MPSVMPEGEPAPGDGALPQNARSEVSLQPLGIYVHVPFCTTRCGYCDFNTYTAAELGSGPGASRAGYVTAAIHELDLAARVLGPDAPVVSTIFVGGGTPTLLPPDDLGRLVTAVRDRFGLAEDAEVTTESNPESIDAAGLCRLRELGFNRISFGMQSVVPRVLATLDRTHSPGRSQRVVAEAKSSRVRQHEPRLDLWNAGGVSGRLAGEHRCGAGRVYGAHQRLRPDRGGGHPAGGSHPAR